MCVCVCVCVCVCTTEHYGLHIVCTKEQALWSTHCLHHTDTAPAEHEQSGPRPNVFPARAELTRPKVFPAREERNRHNVFPARAERRARCRCSVQRVGPGQAGPVEWRATRLLHEAGWRWSCPSTRRQNRFSHTALSRFLVTLAKRTGRQ